MKRFVYGSEASISKKNSEVENRSLFFWTDSEYLLLFKTKMRILPSWGRFIVTLD